MKIEGQHVFAATPQLVWDAVTDPSVLAKVMPGCEEFRAIGENRFEGKMKIKVGPVQGEFLGTVQLSDLVPPRSYRLKLNGKGAPGFVEGDGTLQLVDDPSGGTRLEYSVDAKIGGRIATVGQRLLDSSSKVITRQALEGLEGQVDARIAVHDAGVAAAAAEEAEHQAVAAGAAAEAEAAAAMRSADEQEAASRAAARAAEEAAAARSQAAAKAAAAEAASQKAAQAPSQSEFAATFAKEMAREMIPAPLRKALVFLLAVAAAVAVALLVRGC